jgi:phytoene dehydrogenase-like protein
MVGKTFDVIIIGAGPNGLELGAYLSKAGQKVLILERRNEVGGGLATEGVTVGSYLHNTHAIYMMMVDYAPVYKDCKLEERYLLKHVFPPLQVALPLSDGRCLCLYSDMERTCQSIARFSKKDADSYRELAQRCKQYVSEVIAPATYVPPMPLLDQIVKIQLTELGREMAAFAEKSPKQIIDEYFENEHVKALMLYLVTQWGVPYHQPGMGYLVLLYLDRAANYRMAVGGSHMVSQALYNMFYEHGGVVRTLERIKRIIVTGGVAKGVELEDGTIFQAEKAVVSTIDPHQTFLKLVGKENLEKQFADTIQSWQWEKETIMPVHLALTEAPHFTAATSDPEIDKAYIYLLGYETEEELINDYDAMEQGVLSEKACFNCCFPTVHDPLQAPPGRHTGLLSRHVPYDLKNGGAEKWYNFHFREEMMERCTATLRKYAPNMNDDTILWKNICTPVDTENKFINMVKGSYKHGLYHPLQMGIFRPNEECSQYRTPIKNLYVAGSSTYPGGCVIWGAGYNAANAIVEDYGIEKWWPEPEIVKNAREKGYL